MNRSSHWGFLGPAAAPGADQAVVFYVGNYAPSRILIQSATDRHGTMKVASPGSLSALFENLRATDAAVVFVDVDHIAPETREALMEESRTGIVGDVSLVAISGNQRADALRRMGFDSVLSYPLRSTDITVLLGALLSGPPISCGQFEEAGRTAAEIW
jgi:hypothetical protein